MITGSISLAGCTGNNDDEGETPEPTPEDTESPTPTPTPEDEETPTPTPEDEETPTPTPTPKPEPAFGIAQINSDEIALVSDELFSLDVFVENTGGDGVATVEVSMGPLTTSKESEEIASGESVPVTTELEIGTLERGRYDVTVTVGDSSDSVQVDVFADTDDSGIYGSVMSESGTSLSDNRIQVWGIKDGEYEVKKATVDETEQFYVAHPYDIEYDLTGVVFYSVYGNFNGVPPVFDLKGRGTVTSEVEILGRVEVPEAYRTEVKLVDTAGEPLVDFTAFGVRTPRGFGVGPDSFTTNDDGYVIAREGDETGVAVPTQEHGGYQAEVSVENGPSETFGSIYGTPEGEEYTFEVENPDRFG